MHIDFPTIDPGTGDPPPVFSKNAADLVDVHFFPVILFPDLVDLDGNREGLFRYHDGIKIRIESRTETVIQRFNPTGGLVPTVGDIAFQFLIPYLKRPDRVGLLPCKGIGGKAYHYMSAWTGNGKRAIQETLVTVVKGIERTPYHNLHTL